MRAIYPDSPSRRGQMNWRKSVPGWAAAKSQGFSQPIGPRPYIVVLNHVITKGASISIRTGRSNGTAATAILCAWLGKPIPEVYSRTLLRDRPCVCPVQQKLSEPRSGSRTTLAGARTAGQSALRKSETIRRERGPAGICGSWRSQRVRDRCAQPRFLGMQRRRMGRGIGNP